MKKVNDYVIELYSIAHNLKYSINALLEKLNVSSDTYMNKISVELYDEIVRVVCTSGDVSPEDILDVIVAGSKTDVENMCKKYGKYFVKDTSSEHKIRLYINTAIMAENFSNSIVESLGMEDGTQTSITAIADKLICEAADIFEHPEENSKMDIVDDIVEHKNADYIIEKYRELIRL